MKRLITILLAVMPLFVLAANKQVVILSCDLHCQGCCDKIMKNIAFEKGVKDLVCDLDTKTVTVTYDTRKTDVPTLLAAFDKIGKPATVNHQDQIESTIDASEHNTETDANTGATSLEQ